MIQEKSFESSFNEWYKKFLEIEKELGEKVKEEKRRKEEKLQEARKEALQLIKNYEIEQRENLEATKAKIQTHGKDGKSEDLDKKYAREIEDLQLQYKTNKGKVIDFIITNIFEVDLELPDSIKKKGLIKKH